ncbi:MAG TPA: hypothetical protein DCG54_03740 [Anaerolineae bacterium]|nr:hypothetical protein [Anaerolineae bacterium]
MKNTKIIPLLLGLLLMSISCNFLTSDQKTVLPVTETQQEAAEATQEPTQKAPLLAADENGPQGFSALATSADSVKLSWQAVADAESYKIMVSTNQGKALTVIELGAAATSYEDFLAAPGSVLTYAVQAIGSSGLIGQSVANVTTPARQPNPLQVLAEFDDAAAVSKRIGPSGGSISLEEAGVLYELTLPPGALDADTEISLVPVADLSDWPLDGNMIGVVGIEPEGLALNLPVSLTITPQAGLSDSGLVRVGFSFDGYGSEFALSPLAHDDVASAATSQSGHLARPYPQSGFGDAVREWLSNLRPTGAGEASPEVAAEIVMENPPSDSARAIEQKRAAAEAAEDEMAPLQSEKDLNTARITRWLEYTQREIADAADCSQLKSAIDHFDNELRVLENYGTKVDATQKEALKNKTWDELTDKAKETINDAADNCQKKSGQGGRQVGGISCADTLLKNIQSGSSPFYKEFQKRMLDRYGSQGLAGPREKINQYCVTGYVMSGGTAGMKVPYAFICNINQPFSATGSVYGGSITLKFVPKPAPNPRELPAGGSYTYSGASGGFSLEGEGTFTLFGRPDDGPIKLEAFGPGAVDEHGGAGSESYILTPREHACAKP